MTIINVSASNARVPGYFLKIANGSKGKQTINVIITGDFNTLASDQLQKNQQTTELIYINSQMDLINISE